MSIIKDHIFGNSIIDSRKSFRLKKEFICEGGTFPKGYKVTKLKNTNGINQDIFSLVDFNNEYHYFSKEFVEETYNG